MRALPAIDLRAGACVQLVGGDYAAERVRVPDPVAQARAFRDAGFRALHVVDLDAATGRGDNASVIASILDAGMGEVQVGGGLRSVERARALVDRGASRVVVGTRAVEDAAFRAEIASALPGRVVLALDVRGTEVLVRGWSGGSGLDVFALLGAIADVPLAAVLVTAVHVEGTMQGADAALMTRVAAASPVPVIASGGVGSEEDLAALAAAGCAEVVIGMAIYTGALDPRRVAATYAS
ncbi:MAG: 1-(5-phosphoribosyl)-5-[(5-phosphoribosylamino)methylideneamino] imidazole-4-carboxamide isomerase [Polyangiaceae bacterium]